MGSRSSKGDGLLEFVKVHAKLGRGEAGSVVRDEALGNNANIRTVSFELLEGKESFVAVEMGLETNEDVSRSMVHEDASAGAHLILMGLASGGEEATSNGGEEVVKRNALAWMEMLSLEDSLAVTNSGSSVPRSWSLSLLAIKAGPTSWVGAKRGAALVEALHGLGTGQDARVHEELDLLETEMA